MQTCWCRHEEPPYVTTIVSREASYWSTINYICVHIWYTTNTFQQQRCYYSIHALQVKGGYYFILSFNLLPYVHDGFSMVQVGAAHGHLGFTSMREHPPTPFGVGAGYCTSCTGPHPCKPLVPMVLHPCLSYHREKPIDNNIKERTITIGIYIYVCRRKQRLLLV